MKQPLVSVIVPTRNSCEFLMACLESIRAQTYPNIELIVVDRDSTDLTKQIALKYTPRVYNHGPERSAQRNFGASAAKGKYVVFVDSDMELTQKVIEDCVRMMSYETTIHGVIIPEESFGGGFWADCKAWEKSFYVGRDDIEAARFFYKEVFDKLGGYDEALTAGEDWDLSNRVKSTGRLERINQFIRHNEGRPKLGSIVRKKYGYSKEFKKYLVKSNLSAITAGGAGPFGRYALFFSKPSKLIRHPIVSIGMLFMKTSEYVAGAIGYLN